MRNNSLGDFLSPRDRRRLIETNSSSLSAQHFLRERDELIRQRNECQMQLVEKKSENLALKIQLNVLRNQPPPTPSHHLSYAQISRNHYQPSFTPLRRNIPPRPHAKPFLATANQPTQRLQIKTQQRSSDQYYDSAVPSLRYVPFHSRSSFSFTPPSISPCPTSAQFQPYRLSSSHHRLPQSSPHPPPIPSSSSYGR